MYNRPYSDKVAVAADQKKEEKEYWLNTLSGDLINSYFPFDFHKGGWSKGDIGSIQLKFPDELFHRLMKMTGNSEIRLNVVLVAAVFALLEKYTGNEDIIIGTPISRQDADVDFINTVLTLRKRVRPDVTFKKLILETGQVILEASKNQNYPIERLLYELNMKFSANEVFPLFDVAVLLENIHERRYLRHINTNVVFCFLKNENRMTGTVEYNSAVYTRRTIERIGDHYINLLRESAFNVDTPVAEIDFLSEEEKKKVLVDFNDSSADYPKNKTVVQLFREQVQRAPDNVALVFEDKRLTYKKLDEMSNQLGRLLRGKGVGVDVPVGIMVERSLEMVVGIMGVLKAGGAYVPVSPDAPLNRLTYVFDNANIKIVLTQEKYTADYVELYDLILLDSAASYSGPVENPGNINTPDDLAYIIYTSGSTGKPKGVMIRHRSVVNIVKWFARKYNLKIGFNLLQMFEYTFDASVNQIFGSMLHGVTLHIISKENFFDIEFLRDYITDNFINLINFVQSVIKELLCGREKLESLEHVISGAEKLKSSVKNEILDHGYSLYNQYGPTEVTVDALAEKCSRESNGTVGIPVDNAQCYIVNKFGRLNPVGVAGELWVSGDGLARGYINNVELTALKFIPNPFHPGTRVYKTGDLTRWLPAGNVEFLGRIDNQVKIRGFRIEPVEIANQLVKIDGIKEAVVIDREDGFGETYLCAYLVGTEETGEIDTNEIKRLLAQNLPDYMVPSGFVRIEQLPLSGHGKLIRSELPAPDINRGASEAYAAPGTPLEEKMVDIWAGVLNIDRQFIGVNSDFFELGGHSLKAVILNARIHKELDVRVPLTEVFRAPTVKGLAEYIKKSAKDIYLSLETVEKKEYYALSSAQKRIYILNQMDPQSTAYNMSRIIPLGESVDKQQLENVCRELINRHESLRTSFHMIDETPVQRINDDVEFNVEYYDFAGKTLAEEIHDFVRAFDLSGAPLLRGRVVKTGGSRHYLLVDIHHIISDGTSRVIMDRDFLSLYRGEKLPPLRLQYKDYAEWRNGYEQKSLIKKQERYWSEMFSDGVPVLDLPTDYPRPILQSFEGHSVGFSLTEKESRGLKELGRTWGATAYMCILSIFTVLLSRLSGQEDIVVGTPAAGRRHADLEDIIGIFINTLAVRNSTPGEETFSAFLSRVKKRTLDVFENQEYPFEDLVENVVLERDTSRNPIFDVMFVLQNYFESNQEISVQSIIPSETETYSYGRTNSVFDLSLTGVERGEKYSFIFEYCTRLFREETIIRFIHCFRRIISSVIENPAGKISRIEIIPEEERKRVLYEFNCTGTVYPGDKTIHRLFEEQVEKKPEHIAVVGPSVESIHEPDVNGLPQHRQLTYRKLDERGEQLASWLREKGIGPGIIVGIIEERSIEMIIGILGILKAGGAYLPINPKYPRRRIDFMLKDSGAKMLVTTRIFADEVEALRRSGEDNGTLEIVFLDRPGYLNFSLSHPLVCLSPEASDPAYVIYTSGSTGQPKGVIVEHRNVLRLVKNSNYIDFSPMDRLLLTGALAFDICTFEIWGPLCNGISLFLAFEDVITDAGKLKKVLVNHDISILHLIPQLFNQLAVRDIELFAGLRYFLVGGDLVQPAYINKIRRRFVNLKILHMYGPTENTTFSTFFLVDKDYEERIPIGMPVGNSTVFILDKYHNVQPVGVIGELYTGGDGVARGYLNRPELTAEKFPPAGGLPLITPQSLPLTPLYCTGDLARWLPNGTVEFLGRIDHQVKIRGFRIELGEIERVLLNHPLIKEAVVLTRGDRSGDKYLCAYIVPGAELGDVGLREYLAGHLPGYMIPPYFVTMENIPVTHNGKVDRKALPEPEIEAKETPIVPRNDVEEKLAGIWAEILGIEKDVISMDSNFFALGGHSLKATVMVAKIHKEFNRVVTLSEIFKAPTIEGITSLIGIIDWAENKENGAVADVQRREEIEL
jgi:amino acid adenylation domain-containing protein